MQARSMRQFFLRDAKLLSLRSQILRKKRN